MTVRQSRKREHLELTLALPDGPGSTGFEDFTLIHNCIPDLAFSDIDLSTSIAGLRLRHPVIINAITGGASDVGEVNKDLAELAKRTGAAMAVGSQYSALEIPAMAKSYTVVRENNPDGIIFANLGAHTSPAHAKAAVDMIGANAIQIHLNVAQELIMPEGDRNFKGYLDNIAAIAHECPVPVIVKEVGCGIAGEQAAALCGTGIRAIDVGGIGGTNFIAIEAARGNGGLPLETVEWGIPTAISGVEVAEELPKHIDLVLSGGIRTPLEAVKSLVIGAEAVGIAAPILKSIASIGVDKTEFWLNEFLCQIKHYMLLVGAARIKHLGHAPFVITGRSREWLSSRGVDVNKFATRKRYI